MPYTTEHGWLLLEAFAARLEALCRAYRRPRLEPEDIAADAVMLFIKRAPAWFAMPAQNVEAQAWTLLAFCVRNVVTKHEREASRVGLEDELPGRPAQSGRTRGRRADLVTAEGIEHGERPGAGRAPDLPTADGEEDWRLRVLRGRIALLGPVHRLLVIAVSVPRWLQDELFESAAAAKSDPFRGQLWSDIAQTVKSEAKKTYVGSTEFEDQVAWKRFLRVTFRVRPPREAATEDELRQAVTWLDKNLSRAHALLAMASDEEVD